MIDNQVTINGPRLPPVIYDESVMNLPRGTLLELTDGRWGVRISSGVMVLGGCGVITFFRVMNSECQCRILPGKLEITYTT